jgi:hypothetical protein
VGGARLGPDDFVSGTSPPGIIAPAWRLFPWNVVIQTRFQSGAEPLSLLDAGAHETLDKLALEDEKGDKQRRNGQERAGRDDREIDPRFRRAEDGEAHRDRPHFGDVVY